MSTLRRHLFIITAVLLTAAQALAVSPDLTRTIAASVPQVDALRISVVGDMIVLNGSTTDAGAIAEVERRLRAMGHERIVNGIELVHSRSDAEISSAVERELYRSGLLLETTLAVHSRDGVVFLSGHITRANQVAEVVRIAGRVDGVRDVRPELTVEPQTSR